MKQTKKTFNFESNLDHNNRGYGYGKFWVAKLTGIDPKIGFSREFGEKPIVNYRNTSKTTWFKFETSIEAIEGDYLEVAESNTFKTRRSYFKIENGELKAINKKDINFEEIK